MTSSPAPRSPSYESTLSALRRKGCGDSLQAFGRTYLGTHFRLPASPMHHSIFELCKKAAAERGARVAIAAPRGHAKSTVVSLAFVLWCILYKREAFIVLISNTADQARGLLDGIKHELETNPLILQDFPEVAEPPGQTPSAKRWRREEIITRNGVLIIALGAGQKIRGRKHAEHRPGLVVLDDIENESDVSSAETREQTKAWFERSVLKAGATGVTNVLVVGTLLHYDSLLAHLLGPAGGRPAPGWTAQKYQAVIAWAERDDLWQQWESIYGHRVEHESRSGPEAARAFFEANRDAMLQGSQVLWPEREGYYELMDMRLTEGRTSFDAEKQNDPTDPSTALFKMDQALYWDDQYPSEEALLASLGPKVRIYGACDPSLGRLGKGRDDTAIVSIAVAPDGTMYVLDADISRRPPLETIGAIIEFHTRRKYTLFGIETNQFQDFLGTELQRISKQKCVHVPVRKMSHTTDKHGRIESLEPLIATGTLRLSRRHRTLIDQLRQFPRAAHDDGPDALQMVIDVVRLPRPGIGWFDMRTGEYSMWHVGDPT